MLFGKILFVSALVYALTVTGVYIFQRRLMYHPHQHVNTPHRDRSPDFEKVTLTTSDGLTLAAFYKAPATASDGKEYPTVLYFHGNTGPAGDAAHKLIPIVDAGYGVLLQEYRGYGGNEGKPSEKGLLTDAEAGLDFILSKQGQNATVVYYGMSMGTGVANGLAEKRPPAGLILECGFTTMSDAAQVRYPWLPVRYLIKDTYDSRKRIESLRSPVLFLHGEKDRTVPVEQGKAMYEAAPVADKTLKLYPQGRHTNLYDFGASEEVVRWLSARY